VITSWGIPLNVKLCRRIMKEELEKLPETDMEGLEYQAKTCVLHSGGNVKSLMIFKYCSNVTRTVLWRDYPLC
jgi:hypothetical protein